MTSLKTQKIVNGLKKKGFKTAETDHTCLIFHLGEKKTEIWTKVSHGGGKEIGDNLIHKMAAQVRLDKKGFLNLVECIMTRESYIAELEKQSIRL